jgi:prephenate dehydrogenase
MRWQKVTLLGVGLLGGSLGLALRKRRLAAYVEGYVRREASITECSSTGAVDHATCDLNEAVRDADLIVFCTPLAQMQRLARSFVDSLAPGVLLTDVGSVKGQIVAELGPILEPKGVFFVGSHPMAGSEKTGVKAARADLFEKALCIITPAPVLPEAPVARIEQLWQSVGARTLRLTPELHDELAARSSHLPHVIASHLASYVLDPAQGPDQSRLCANGFRDTTRIASGSPEMWRDIVMMNKDHLLRALADFGLRLKTFEAVLERSDPAEIESFLEKAKTLRDQWNSQSPSESAE